MQRPREFEVRKLPALKPHPRNVRKHPAKQIDLLVKSIKQFNVTQPPLIDENDVILAGAARVIAATKAGLDEIPVIVRRDLSEAEKRVYVLADNRLAQLSGYDRPALADELQDLASLLATEGLDFELTGFEPAEVDALFADLVDHPGDLDEALPELSEETVSRPGDLWILGGKHRLLCDDARHADYARLMQGNLAKMIFADVPYNIDVTKAVGRGRTKHRNFVMAAGEMSPAEFTIFLGQTLGLAAKSTANGALCYFCIDWRHQREMLDAGAAVFDNNLKALIVWAKTTPAQGSLYRSQHELIYVYKNGDAPHLNNIELGKHGRNRSNVWTYPGANTFRSERMADLAAHPTVKPIPLVADAIRDCTRRGDIILDPFVGSGSTLLAAEKVGRRGYAVEIDPIYSDVAARRWMMVTKSDVIIVPQDIPTGRGHIHHRQVNEVLHPQFESKAELDQQRDSMGPTPFSAQYLQRPVPIDGALMDAAWFRYYDELPERDARSYILQSWDTASKDGLANSLSTCTTWLVHQQSRYLIDVFRKKLKFPTLRETAIELSKRYQPRYILIEDASTGPALADELQRELAVGIKLIKPEQDKQVRLFIQQGKFSSGQVWFPRQAPRLRTFLEELLSFPDSRYSDQVDSLSQALAYKGGYDPGAIVDFLESLTDSYAARYMMATSVRLF